MKVVKKKNAVTAPIDFVAAGCNAGLKKGTSLDVALVYSKQPTTSAAMFTKNNVKAWPVELSMIHDKLASQRAVIVNSGNANCANGIDNRAKAVSYVKSCAATLGIADREVFVCSTGVIGRALDAEKIEMAIPELAEGLSRSGGHAAAEAIMTTDTRPKEACVTIPVGNKKITIGAMAKGAGMIRPDMATMLAFFTTDAAIARPLLRSMLKDVVSRTFNHMSIDNDMSTNDTVFMMANGASGITIKKGTREYQNFCMTLEALMWHMVYDMLSDGEGVTKVCTIIVAGAKSQKQAVRAGKAIADSMLFKTALHGADPNWGRILSAVGSCEDVQVSLANTLIAIGGHVVFEHGAALEGALKKAQRAMQKNDVVVHVDLGKGKGTATCVTTDLTKEYININAHYTT